MKLATTQVTTNNAEPKRWLQMLPGIFGSGRNWGSVARRLVRARPDWGVLLVDLRQHGASQGFPPPHTVAAAAGDLGQLQDNGQPVAAILGHSFGGKVALTRAAQRPSSIEQVWIIDSTPAPHPPSGSAWSMLGVIRTLPDRFENRDAVVEALALQGVQRPVAQWMATNVEESENGYRWRFDIDAIEQLLVDFFDTDLWSIVEDPPEGLEVHVVKAEESSVLSGANLERADRATRNGRTFLHRVAGGHWVNADNPQALHALLIEYLPSS
jgi:pimeloyl-ACP methyl ester carboxylesterase